MASGATTCGSIPALAALHRIPPRPAQAVPQWESPPPHILLVLLFALQIAGVYHELIAKIGRKYRRDKSQHARYFMKR